MNREVLTGLYVGDGHSYANDALQKICSKICNYSLSEIMKLQSEIEDLAWLKEQPYSAELLTEKQQIRYHELADAQNLMMILFNKIVSHGSEFAIQFIEANSWAWK